MKSILFILFLIHNAQVVVPRGDGINPNYCGAKMCGKTNAHTFCRYPVGPSPQCLGYMRSRLSPQEKTAIVARLNRRRNDAASGKLLGLPSAANMMRLHWVEELALGAQRWADQCQTPQVPEEKDVCRDLFTISVGQAVASVIGDAPGLLVETLVDIWFLQNLQYKGLVTSYSSPPTNSSYYGDFAQMIWARTYLVGCGRSRFMATVGGRLRGVIRLVCNFAPRGPAPRYPLWTPGLPVSLCPAQSVPDPELPALCDFYFQEVQDLYYYQKFLEQDDKVNKTALKKSKKYRRSNKMTTVQLIGRPKSYEMEDLLGSTHSLEDNKNDVDGLSTPTASTELDDYESSQDEVFVNMNKTIENISSLSFDKSTTKFIEVIFLNELKDNRITNESEDLSYDSVNGIMKMIQKRIKELNKTEIDTQMLKRKIMETLKSIDQSNVDQSQELLLNSSNFTRAGKVRRELSTITDAASEVVTTVKDVSFSKEVRVNNDIGAKIDMGVKSSMGINNDVGIKIDVGFKENIGVTKGIRVNEDTGDKKDIGNNKHIHAVKDIDVKQEIENKVVVNKTIAVTNYVDVSRKITNDIVSKTTKHATATKKSDSTKSEDEYDDYDDEEADKSTSETIDDDSDGEEEEDIGQSTESTFQMIMRFMPHFQESLIKNNSMISQFHKNRAMAISPAFILLLTCVL